MISVSSSTLTKDSSTIHKLITCEAVIHDERYLIYLFWSLELFDIYTFYVFFFLQVIKISEQLTDKVQGPHVTY